MEIVVPCKPVAPWLGGKSRLAERIIARIEVIPHTTYAEPFAGMGGVFLRRTKRPKAEVLNDANGEIANLFRVLQKHYIPFIEMIRWQITTREGFDRLRATQPATLTDLERAARFLYLQRLVFGGKPTACFGVSPESAARFDVTKLAPMLDDLHTRLSGVTVENLDYRDFLIRYDRAGTLFYLDPPYYGCEGDYGKALFGREEFALMAELLRGLKGRFILSPNDRPEVREIFSGFAIEDVKTTYSVGQKGRGKQRGEVLISDGRHRPLILPQKLT
jgi:DNA adenine methylase